MAPYFTGMWELALEVFSAILPIAAITALLRPILGPFPFGLIRRVAVGLSLTFIGTVLFLQGVNVGFLPVGEMLGHALASGPNPILLIPFGLWIGFVVALAEPAVKVLGEEVETVSSGSLKSKPLTYTIAVGVGVLVAVAMWRVLAGIPLLYILIPGYAIAFALAALAPPAYTSIAFDSGGVVTGPITVTFILAVSMGAAAALEGRDPLTEGFGLVALVLLAPSLSVLGFGALVGRAEREAQRRTTGRDERAVKENGGEQP